MTTWLSVANSSKSLASRPMACVPPVMSVTAAESESVNRLALIFSTRASSVSIAPRASRSSCCRSSPIT